MPHKSFDQLNHELADAAKVVEIGGEYRHYKNRCIYTALGLLIIEATDEVAVRYSEVDEPSIEFIRPLSSWIETIDGTSRFTKVRSSN